MFKKGNLFAILLSTGLIFAGPSHAEMPDSTYRQFSSEAAARWPALAEKYQPETGFDPHNPMAFKGKVIHITTDNLIGYKFSPGTFPFATTINGLPVAGTFDPTVAAAVVKIERELGRALGDNDDDGKWEVFAVVEGTMGELSKREEVEAQVGNETLRAEGHRGVAAPIVRIIAAHCGPLVVASAAGG